MNKKKEHMNTEKINVSHFFLLCANISYVRIILISYQLTMITDNDILIIELIHRRNAFVTD